MKISMRCCRHINKHQKSTSANGFLLAAVFLCSLLFHNIAFAQDSSITAEKIAIDRARKAIIKCEDDLASIWSQAENLNKVHQDLIKENEKLKKQLEEKATKANEATN